MKNKHFIGMWLAIAAISGLITGTALAAGGGGVQADSGAMEGKHFHPKGKLPSKYTIEAQEQQRKI